MLLEALTLGAGYNAALVAVGAGLLGAAAGAAGTFLYLRKRALVSDAISHATLPGVCLAFIVMVVLGGSGRWLPGLMAGSALSAGLGLLAVQAMTRATRLGEDAAIGAVLSSFFGLGVVLLTVIQTMDAGRQAGVEDFLLGATAGMLMGEALTIAVGGALAAAAVVLLARPMILTAFDPGFAAATGVRTARIDLAVMGLVMAVTIVGLKIVGLILIVALLIIPAVAARFWSDRAGHVAMIAAAVGGLSGYVGAAISASAPDLPTGPIIVLVVFTLFLFSFLFAPGRGVAAALVRHRNMQRQVHLRQGLLALAQGQPILERYTRTLLRRARLTRRDGVATETGRARAARMLRDEARWAEARQMHAHEGDAHRYDGLTPIDAVLTPDEIAEIDRRLGPPRGVSA